MTPEAPGAGGEVGRRTVWRPHGSHVQANRMNERLSSPRRTSPDARPRVEGWWKNTTAWSRRRLSAVEQGESARGYGVPRGRSKAVRAMGAAGIPAAEGAEPPRGAVRPSGLLDELGMASVVLDAEGRIVLWSPQAEELFGYTAREALGQYAAHLMIHEQH